MMNPMQYSLAVDPMRDCAWLVLQRSTDFDGWVVLKAFKTSRDAKAMIVQLQQMEQELLAMFHGVGEAAHDEKDTNPTQDD